jgi:hypothetical protein
MPRRLLAWPERFWSVDINQKGKCMIRREIKNELMTINNIILRINIDILAPRVTEKA